MPSRSRRQTSAATTVPAESPIAARISGRSHTTRACISRPAASASPAASSSTRGTPKIQSAASPSNLLTKPPCRCVVSTTIPKNALSIATTSVAPRSAANDVEPIRSTNSTAASRSSPPSATPSSIARRATSWPTWRPNRSRRRSRSRRPDTMRLNPAWRNPTSLPSSTATRGSRLPASASTSARRRMRSGSEIDCAKITMAPSPTTSAMTPRHSAVAATRCAETGRARETAAIATTPITGTAVPSAHANSARVATPGTRQLLGGAPASARDCRPSVPLGKEIRDGCGSHASERDGNRDLEGEKPRGRHVQEVEQYDAARPQTGLHPQQPESEPERQLAFALGWRSLLEEPSRRGIRLLEAQCHTRGNDNADVGNRGDQVPQHQLCRAGGPALELRWDGQHEHEQHQDDPRSDEVCGDGSRHRQAPRATVDDRAGLVVEPIARRALRRPGSGPHLARRHLSGASLPAGSSSVVTERRGAW